MDVVELVATLALSIDDAAWKKAEDLISKVKGQAEKVGEETEKAAEKAEGGWKELNEKLQEGLETLIGYEGIKTFGELIEGAQSLAFETSKMAQRIGVTTQALQGLTYAAQQSDVSADSLQYGLQRLAYNVSVVGEHSQWTDQALNKLGMTQAEISGKLKRGAGLDEVLGDIAEKFQKMPDGATKASVAMQLFGRTAGPEMIPLLDKGRDGLDALRKEAEDLGIVLDKDAIEAVNENEKAQRRLQAQWEGLKFTIMTQLIPAVHALIDAFSKVVSFFQKHREFLYATLAGLAAAIIAVGVAAAAAWWDVVKPVLIIEGVVSAAILGIQYAIEAFKGKWGVAGIVIASVATLITTVLVAALATLTFWLYAEEIAAATAWLATLGPLALIPLAIALVTAAIYELIKHWDWVKEKVLAVADAVTGALGAAWHWVIDEGTAAVHWFEKQINRVIAAYHKAKHVFDDVVDVIPMVGVARTIYGLATGDGTKAFRHLPGVGLGADAYHALAGSGDTNHVEVHNTVTIHTGADPDAVKQVVNDTFDKSLRDAMKATKKGG